MRTVKIKLADSVIECGLSWKVMKGITEQVADPVMIAQEVQRQVKADADNKEYTPKIALDTNACVKIIAIASDMDEDEIGELFMAHGIVSAQAETGMFLAELLGVGGGRESAGKKKAPKSP